MFLLLGRQLGRGFFHLVRVDPLPKEPQGLVEATHLEGRDAWLDQRIPIHQEFFQYSTLSLPQLQQRMWHDGDVIVHHPNLPQELTVSNTLGQLCQGVVGSCQLPQTCEPPEGRGQLLNVVVVHVQNQEPGALQNAVGQTKELVVREIEVTQLLRARDEVAGEEGQLVPGEVQHLQAGHQWPRESTWFNLLQFVSITRQRFQSQRFQVLRFRRAT
mmetsp:Transcript_16674/g.36809  ORF Transcript_16674/g.36809 Transcript_16674/m.36809 type:complete len:215 (+) Transcript_16674:1120-1764(+)